MMKRVLCAMLSLVSGAAIAQAWPTKPINTIVQFPAGGGSDAIMRILAPRLSENIGQQVIVENRVGASGTIGAAYVAKAAPDGYTLLCAHAISNAIAPHVLKEKLYDPFTDFTAITYIGFTPNVLAVALNVPAKSAQELIALAKREPGKLTYGSSGSGSTQHLAAEVFSMRTGIKMTHVPYKGSSQTLVDLLAGRITMNFDPMPTVLPHIKSGKLMAFAISTSTRRPQLPDVPTFGEVGVQGFDVTNWYAVMGPKGLAPDIVAKVDAAMKKTMAEPAIRERLEGLGVMFEGPATPADFDAFVKRENEKYARIVKDLNIRAD